jgi:hypothetical protein
MNEEVRPASVACNRGMAGLKAEFAPDKTSQSDEKLEIARRKRPSKRGQSVKRLHGKLIRRACICRATK